MQLLTTTNKSFDVEWASPVSVTENIVFLAKIINSDVDSVHNTFKDPNETGTLRLEFNPRDPVEEFTGYTRYAGFDVANDGSITVTLKKQL